MCANPRVSLRVHTLVCLALLAISGVAVADQEIARTPIVDAPPGTPGIGGGFRFHRTAYTGVGLVQDLVPLYLYEGKYLYGNGRKARACISLRSRNVIALSDTEHTNVRNRLL